MSIIYIVIYYLYDVNDNSTNDMGTIALCSNMDEAAEAAKKFTKDHSKNGMICKTKIDTKKLTLKIQNTK